MPDVHTHSPEAAYATKVDDKGRPNIVAPHFLSQAAVTAMQTAADTDLTNTIGVPTSTHSGSSIKKGN